MFLYVQSLCLPRNRKSSLGLCNAKAHGMQAPVEQHNLVTCGGGGDASVCPFAAVSRIQASSHRIGQGCDDGRDLQQAKTGLACRRVDLVQRLGLICGLHQVEQSNEARRSAEFGVDYGLG